jgi:hypothetical protein
MGQSMLTAFYESIDLSGYAVVEVELPLSARLYSDDGLPTDFMLVGILDLLLMDENDEAVVVDNKTAAQPMSQASADENLQMSAYAYLLAANRYVFPTAPVKCRFDVLRKLKTPKLEQVRPSAPPRIGNASPRSPTRCWLVSMPASTCPSPVGCVPTVLIRTPVRRGRSEKIRKYIQKPRTPLYGPLRALRGVSV